MWGRAQDSEERADHRRPLPPLTVVEDLESLGGGLSEEQRQIVLARLSRLIGATDLWSFVKVEDDFFLRDCVGAVPDAEEISTVTDAQAASKRWPGEDDGSGRRVVVHPPVAGSGLVLAAAFGRGGVLGGARGQEIFDCLATALVAEEMSAPYSSELGARLKTQLTLLAERLIHDALSLAGGNRDRAAALLGVPRRELERLDPATGPS